MLLYSSSSSSSRSSNVLWLWLFTTTITTLSWNASTAFAASSNDFLFFNTIRLIPKSIFRNPKRAAGDTPYDRIIGQPVFQVTNPGGSSYLSFEKRINRQIDADLDDYRRKGPMGAASTSMPNRMKAGSSSSQQGDYKQITAYFMDPEDAIAVHGEMLQMEGMEEADVRISTTSLGKALRSAANYGIGLVSGLPIDRYSGYLKSPKQHGSLRHKIVPSRRQLFYASRCIGRERIGLQMKDTITQSIASMCGIYKAADKSIERTVSILDTPEETNLRKQLLSSPSYKRTVQTMRQQNPHMSDDITDIGGIGIPVFWAQGTLRRPNKLNQLLTGNRNEILMYFNYEDLLVAWDRLKQRKKYKHLPDRPTVEVFNLWDLLTSMDREMSLATQTQSISTSQSTSTTKNWWKRVDWTKPIRNRLGSRNVEPTLADITFVPSSRAVHFKRRISAHGNGKPRLRPMR